MRMQSKMRAAIKAPDTLPAVPSSQNAWIRPITVSKRLHFGANAPAGHHMGLGYMAPSVVTAAQQVRQEWHPVAARLVACSAAGTSEPAGNGVQLEVKVDGMKCGGCSSRVEEALKAMQHVKAVQVDLDSKLATLQVEAANQNEALDMLPSFIAAIKDLGFEAEAAGKA